MTEESVSFIQDFASFGGHADTLQGSMLPNLYVPATVPYALCFTSAKHLLIIPN